jgi:hypothetical protein
VKTCTQRLLNAKRSLHVLPGAGSCLVALASILPFLTTAAAAAADNSSSSSSSSSPSAEGDMQEEMDVEHHLIMNSLAEVVAHAFLYFPSMHLCIISDYNCILCT